MSVVADPLLTGPQKGNGLRWIACLLAVLVGHLALAAVLYDWRAHPPMDPLVEPLVMLDLEPLPVPEPLPPPPPPPQPEPPPPEPEPIPEPTPAPTPEVVLPPPPPKPKPKPPVKPPEVKPIEQPVVPPPPVTTPRPPDPTPPPPQPAVPSTVAPGVQAAYLGRISAAVQQNMRLPGSARFLKDKRTVDVRFTVDRTGKLLALKIEKTSGRDLFDDEALEAFRRTALPAFPDELPSEQLQVVITLNFTLR